MKKYLKTTFWLLVVLFAFICFQIAVPFIRGTLFLAAPAIFFILGLVLLIGVIKQKKTLLIKFLLLTGLSAVSFFAGTVLHNVFYALGTLNIPVLTYLFEGLHILFFFVAIPIAPLGFLIGMIGSIVLFIKGNRDIKNKGHN